MHFCSRSFFTHYQPAYPSHELRLTSNLILSASRTILLPFALTGFVTPVPIFIPSADQSRMSNFGSRSFYLIRFSSLDPPEVDVDRWSLQASDSHIIDDLHLIHFCWNPHWEQNKDVVSISVLHAGHIFLRLVKTSKIQSKNKALMKIKNAMNGP